MITRENLLQQYPHLTDAEANMVVENANAGNRVAIPRTGFVIPNLGAGITFKKEKVKKVKTKKIKIYWPVYQRQGGGNSTYQKDDNFYFSVRLMSKYAFGWIGYIVESITYNGEIKC